MRNKSVAVLDIRSQEVTAAVAQKGVNNTFILKSRSVVRYDGYAQGELINTKDFQIAVRKAYDEAITSFGAQVKELYVAIPGEFLRVEQNDKVISFQSPERISSKHVDNLVYSAMPSVGGDETVILSSPLYYVLSDNRKVISPIGETSSNLRVKLSFFICKNSFLECIRRAFDGIAEIRAFNWVPQIYAQIMYLVPPEKRDNFAVILDLGEISSTFAVICGNGLAFCESFSVGVDHMAVLLMDALKIPYGVALWFISNVNLNSGDKAISYEEYNDNGKIYRFPTSQLKELLREGLDGLCGMVEECRQAYVGKDLSGKPIMITGEGVGVIRGLNEHLSSRLVAPVEVVVPGLPYYNKPHFSSLFSLFAAALG